MRKLILLILVGLSISCAHHKTTKPKYTPAYVPPSVSQVQTPIRSAKTVSERLIKVVEIQPIDQTKLDLEEISRNLADAERFSQELQIEINKSVERLNQATKDRDKAIEEAAYWNAKQVKSLKIIWFYRSIVIGIVAIIAGIVLFKLGIIGAKTFF